MRRSLPDAGGPLIATIRVAAQEVGAVASAPDSTVVVSACGFMLDVWDLATHDRVRRIGPLAQPFGRGSRMRVLSNGDTLIAMPGRGPVAAYSISSGEQLWSLGGGSGGTVAEMGFSADERRLVTSNSRYVVLWEMPARKQLWRIELPPEAKGSKHPTPGRQFRGVGITPDGERICGRSVQGSDWRVERQAPPIRTRVEGLPRRGDRLRWRGGAYPDCRLCGRALFEARCDAG